MFLKVFRQCVCLLAAAVLTLPAYAFQWGSSSNNDRESRYYSAADFKREMGYKEPARVQEKSWWQKTTDSWESSWRVDHERVSAIEYGIQAPKVADYSALRSFEPATFKITQKVNWFGEFDIRNTYHAADNEHSVRFLRIEPNAKTNTADFVLREGSSHAKLQQARSVDVYVHGFNTGAKGAKKFLEDYVDAMDSLVGYRSTSAVISWSGDVGGATGFNQSIQSSRFSASGVANVMAFLHEQNPAMRVNVVTYSLGARTILNAAAEGVKFDKVVMMLPAVDCDELSDTQRFSAAIQNIAHLTIVYSKNQQAVFGVYNQARFEQALGLVGARGTVTHPSVQFVDASKAKSNRWQMEINNHGDLYEKNTLKFLKEMLEKKDEAR